MVLTITRTIIIAKPLERLEYERCYSRQLIGVNSFESDTATLDEKHSFIG